MDWTCISCIPSKEGIRLNKVSRWDPDPILIRRDIREAMYLSLHMHHTHQGRLCEHREKRQPPTTQGGRLNQLSTLWQLDFCLPVSRTIRKQLPLFSHSVVSSSLQPHGLQNASLPCPSPSPGACSNSCPLSQWCCPEILSSVIPFCYSIYPLTC